MMNRWELQRWIDDLAPLVEREGKISAKIYNLWIRLRRRIRIPFQWESSWLVRMSIVLDHRFWVCLERRHSDVPVIVWDRFAEKERMGIHDPVICRLRYYHFAATRIRHKVLEEIFLRLQQEAQTRANPWWP